MRRFIPLVLASTALAVIGCGGGNQINGPANINEPANTNEPANIAGTYTLQTVNHRPLPFTTYQDDTQKDEILSWVVTLEEDNAYSYVFRVRATNNGQVVVSPIKSSGTYTVNGSQVVMFNPENNNSLPAVVVETSLTIVIAGPLGVFTLQFGR